jgi:hypothetical protein
MRSERSEFAELFEPGIDFGAVQDAETVDAEALAAEASHNGAVNDCAAQFAAGDVVGFKIETLLCEIADKSAGEAVAGSCGIERILRA